MNFFFLMSLAVLNCVQGSDELVRSSLIGGNLGELLTWLIIP